MNARRVICRLDIKGPNLVKGIHLEGLRVLGRPESFASHYYKTGADELIYMDVVASLYERNSLQEMITKTAREIFIPLTVGGGIRSIDDIKSILRAGADKVSLNTAAIRNPDLIRAASRRFGSSTITVAIETIRQNDGRYFAYTDNGREHTGLEAIAWAREAERLGAGEILLTSVDREGSGQGFDLALVRAVRDAVSIPVIAHGGPGNVQHVVDGLVEGGADAVAIASVLHYGALEHMPPPEQCEEGNLEFMRRGSGTPAAFSPASLGELKRAIAAAGVAVRPALPQGNP